MQGRKHLFQFTCRGASLRYPRHPSDPRPDRFVVLQVSREPRAHLARDMPPRQRHCVPYPGHSRKSRRLVLPISDGILDIVPNVAKATKPASTRQHVYAALLSQGQNSGSGSGSGSQIWGRHTLNNCAPVSKPSATATVTVATVIKPPVHVPFRLISVSPSLEARL